MLNKSISVICAILFLLHQSQGFSLSPSRLIVSRRDCGPRGNPYCRLWWSQSSEDGYKPGREDLASSGSSKSVNDDSYADPNAISRSTQRGSSESCGRQNLTTGYNSGKPASSSPEVQEWLDQHNKVRSQYGAPPLQWNQRLVQASKRLVDTCVWKHTPENQYGENIAAGQSSIQEVVNGWVNGPNEKDSYTGSNSQPSHFTQVIWYSTTELGCYSRTCRDVQGANLPQSPVTFWACNYNPPGNVIGEFSQNVKARVGGKPL